MEEKIKRCPKYVRNEIKQATKYVIISGLFILLVVPTRLELVIDIYECSSKRINASANVNVCDSQVSDKIG